MEFLRTPDERFADLPDYPWAPNYAEVPAGDGTGDRLRMHWITDGPADAAETVLMLHGEPSWSFLYRKMIPIVAAAGHRVIAPDLVGFGRSDKPASRHEYTYARHIEWLRALLFDELDLRDVTLVCQDWGGLLGTRLVAEHPDRFRRVVTANTFLPTGDNSPGPAFLQWLEFSQNVPVLPVGRIVYGGTHLKFGDDIVAAYDAPFPDESYKEGARQFPTLVPASPDDPATEANRAAWRVLETLTIPWLCAFGGEEKITIAGYEIFQRHIPGCAGQAHRLIPGGGHFLQEDVGPELAAAVVEFIAAN